MSASAYVQPVPKGTKVMRSDQGQDYQGKPGQSVVAIGRAHVDAIKPDPGGFGKVVYYTLLDGPSKGQQIYVGHAEPSVRVGQDVAAGRPVALLLQHPLGNATAPGWTEVGLARNGVPQYAAPQGGPALHALLKGASAAVAAQQAAQVPPEATQGTTPTATPLLSPDGSAPVVAQQEPALPTDLQLPQSNVQMPASQTFAPTSLANLWQTVAQDDFVSPDTTRMIQNAQLASGVPPVGG